MAVSTYGAKKTEISGFSLSSNKAQEQGRHNLTNLTPSTDASDREEEGKRLVDLQMSKGTKVDLGGLEADWADPRKD
jgi:hypothetical protein